MQINNQHLHNYASITSVPSVPCVRSTSKSTASPMAHRIGMYLACGLTVSLMLSSCAPTPRDANHDHQTTKTSSDNSAPTPTTAHQPHVLKPESATPETTPSGDDHTDTDNTAPNTQTTTTGEQSPFPIITEAEKAFRSGKVSLADCLILGVAQNRNYRSSLSRLTVADLQRARARAQVHAPSLNAEYRIIQDDNDVATSRAQFATTAFGFDITPFIEQDWDQNGQSMNIITKSLTN